MTGLMDITVNCPSAEIADRIADALIAGRLAACTNRLAEVESRYFWEGRVEQAREVPLLIHSRADLFDAVAAEVRRHHPDDTPSILGVAVARASDDYATWLIAETGG